MLAALVSLAGQRGELMADLLGSDSAEFDARLRLLTDADPGSRASDEWQDRLDALLEWLLAGPASRLVRAVVGRAFEVSERLRSDPVIQDDSTADGPSQLAGTDDLGAKVSARSRSRVVNLALTEDGRILRPEEPLRAGQRSALRYDIGTRADHSLVPAGSAPLPEEALPRSEAGHWLEVVVNAVGVDEPAQRFSIYLPLTGPAWQCDCASDAHHCRREDRRPYAEVPFTVQAGTARVILRVGTYFGANLLQLHVVIADVDDLVALSSLRTPAQSMSSHSSRCSVSAPKSHTHCTRGCRRQRNCRSATSVSPRRSIVAPARPTA